MVGGSAGGEGGRRNCYYAVRDYVDGVAAMSRDLGFAGRRVGAHLLGVSVLRRRAVLCRSWVDRWAIRGSTDHELYSTHVTSIADSINAWARLDWRDPVQTLRQFRALEYSTVTIPAADRVRRLRTGDMRQVREGRDAALFTHGVAAVTGRKVYFAPYEAADYDFVTSWVVDETRHYCPVQLKELPPADLTNRGSLEELQRSLQKYQQTDTVLALLLNRPAQMSTADLRAIPIPFAQVWLFWCASADHARWMIQGDLLTSPATYDFGYPGPEGAV